MKHQFGIFSVLSGCLFLKKFKNEKSLPLFPLEVLVIQFLNHICTCIKCPKNGSKFITHNPSLPTIRFQPFSSVLSDVFKGANLFRSFHITNLTTSLDGVVGNRTWGDRLVGADKSTELWRHPCYVIVKRCREYSIIEKKLYHGSTDSQEVPS